MPIATSAFAFLVQIEDQLHHLDTASPCGTQVSSLWNAFCCRKPRRMTLGNLQRSASGHPEERRCRSALQSPSGCSPGSESPACWLRYVHKLGRDMVFDTRAPDRSNIRCSWSASGSQGNVSHKPAICPVPRSSGRNASCSALPAPRNRRPAEIRRR